MPDSPCHFCLVLHAHTPYVLNHGTYPHGEHWIYEAAAECYLPLLNTFDELTSQQININICIGFTPILLEQLDSSGFRDGFSVYLEDRIERAEQDYGEFHSKSEQAAATQADFWRRFYNQQLKMFNRINGNIPGAFAEHAQQGHLEILTGAATHAYLPLLATESSLHAQIIAGQAVSSRILGINHAGFWLPECAFRPTGIWQPAVPVVESSHRQGLNVSLAERGVTHFFTEGPPSTRGDFNSWSHPMGVLDKEGYRDCVAFQRHTKLCQQIWCAKTGYPGSPEYLEFHKKHRHNENPPGLRYWKVTGRNLDLGDKEPYNAREAEQACLEHAGRFCESLRAIHQSHQKAESDHAVITACFDAELFGHWWFEGPEFIRQVLLEIDSDPSLNTITATDYLAKHPPKKSIHLTEGSWGENQNHTVWLNEETTNLWEIEYRAEFRLEQLVEILPWKTCQGTRDILEGAARELLLMQASDWPFLVHTKQAADYAIKRFCSHATRFDNACDIAQKIGQRKQLTALDKHHLVDTRIHDDILPKINLNWWIE